MYYFKKDDVYEDYDATESVGDSELLASLEDMEKVKSFLKQVVSFILWSSVNSNKISLTLKAGIPFLVLWGVGDADTLDSFVGLLGEFLIHLAGLITGAITIFALGRKIWFAME